MVAISNKLAYTFILFGILVAIAVGINALAPGVAPNPGHTLDGVAPPSGCAAGEFLKWNDPNWDCVSIPASGGDITGVTAGIGLLGGGLSGDVALSADTNYLQRRVSQTCDQTTAIRVINADGSVICQSVGNGQPLTGTCPPGQFVNGIFPTSIECSTPTSGWQSQGWVSITNIQANDPARDPSVSCTNAGMVPCEDSQGYLCEQSDYSDGTSGGEFVCPQTAKTDQIFWYDYAGVTNWACFPSGPTRCGAYPIIRIHCCTP